MHIAYSGVKMGFDPLPTDVDHGTIQPIPTENVELNFSVASRFHGTLG